MKTIILGDLHLGIKDSNSNFINFQNNFFENVLIKYLEEQKINPKEYQAVLLGDVFHNRRIVNIKTVAQIYKLFSKLEKYFSKIFVIVGNHDLYFRNSYDLSASKLILKEINSNVIQFEEYLFDESTNSLYLNWKNTKVEYLQVFNSLDESIRNKIKYIFGHFELFNYKFNSFTHNEDTECLSEKDIISHFPNLIQVYSGHYHNPQIKNKTKFVGVPYQLTWSEYGEQLGFYELNFKTGKEKFIENPFQIFNFIEFQTSQEIVNFKLEEMPFKRIFKILFKDEKLKDLIETFKDSLNEKGHDVVIINTFNQMIASYSTENDDLNRNLSIEKLLHKYIFEEIEMKNKELFFNLFMKFYEKVKSEMGSNIEII